MIWGLSSAHFDFGKSIRKSKTMVQLQVAVHAIAKSRLQIKPKPINGSSKKSILIFSVAGAFGAVCRFYRSRKGPLCHFLNPRLNVKPRVVHLNCTLMACGVRNTAPKEKYLKLLEFRHFERHIVFSQSERKEKKKAISNGVNVQVVVRV